MQCFWFVIMLLQGFGQRRKSGRLFVQVLLWRCSAVAVKTKKLCSAYNRFTKRDENTTGTSIYEQETCTFTLHELA